MPFKPPTHRPHGQTTRRHRQRQYDQRRGPERQFYGTAAWRKFRAAFLAEHPLCEDCEAEGRTTVATEVHHALKRSENPEATFDEAACMALCKGCHSQRTRRGE